MARLAPLFSGVLLAFGLGAPGLVAAQPGSRADVGQIAPAFTLVGPSMEPVRLSDYAGERVVMLQFQPGDVLQACDGDLVSRRDGYAQFREAGAEIITITVDRPTALGWVQEVLGLPYPLLSDESREATRRYAVLDPASGVARRAYVVIDRHGMVRFKRVLENPGERLTNDTLILEIRRAAR
jgi:peroxiredoxin